MTPLTEEEKANRPMNLEEVMEYLRVGRNTSLSLLQSGKVNAVQVGRQWRVTRKALDEFLSGKAANKE